MISLSCFLFCVSSVTIMLFNCSSSFCSFDLNRALISANFSRTAHWLSIRTVRNFSLSKSKLLYSLNSVCLFWICWYISIILSAFTVTSFTTSSTLLKSCYLCAPNKAHLVQIRILSVRHTMSNFWKWSGQRSTSSLTFYYFDTIYIR